MQNCNSKFKNSDIKLRSYKFSIVIIKFLDKLPKSYIYQTIGKQLLRSSTSIGANIIEAQAGSSKKDFTNFISYALKSSNETKYWLCLLRDTLDIDIIHIIIEANEISKILAASVLKLKGRR